MTTMNRWQKWGIALAALILLLCALVFTATGNRLLLGVVNWAVNGLTVELHEGTILGGGRLSVDYQSEPLTLKLDDLRIKTQWFGCAGICADVSGKTAHIKLSAGSASDADEPPKGDLEPITAPMDFERLAFNFAKITITVDKTQAEIERLALSGRWQGKKLELANVNLAQVKLILPADETNTPVKQNDTLTELPAIAELPIVVPLELSLKQLNLKSFYLMQGDEQKHIRDISLQAQARPKHINWQALSVKYQQFGLTSAGTLSHKKAWQIETQTSLTSPQQHVMVTAKGALSALDMAVLLKGEVNGNVKAKVNFSVANWPFELEGQSQKLALSTWLDSALNDLELTQLTLNGSGNADDYQFELAGSVYSQQTQKVDVSGMLKGTLSGLVFDNAEILNGPTKVRLTANANWQQALLASAQANITQLPLSWFIAADQAPNGFDETIDADIDVSVSAQDEHWVIGVPKLDVRGQFQGKPIAAAARLSLNEQLYGEVEQLALKLGDSRIDLHGKLSDTLDLKGEVNINHRADELLPVAVVMQGALKISGSRTAPDVWLDAKIPAAVHSEGELHQGILELNLSGENDWAGKLALSTERLIYQGQQLNHVTLLLNGNRASHQLDVVSSGAVEAALSASGGWQNEQWQGTLNQASIDLSQNPTMALPPLTLKAPLAIRASMTDWQLAEHCWLVATSELCLNAEQNTHQGNQSGLAQLKVKQFNLVDVNRWLNQSVKLRGQTTGAFALNWADGRLSAITGALSGDGVELESELDGERTILPLEQLQAKLNSDNAKAQLDWQLQSSLIGAVKGQLHMPLTGDNLVPWGNVDVVDMQLKPLAPLLSKLFKQRLSIEGQVAGSVQLTQLTRLPVVTGKLGVSQLTLEGALLPVALKSSDALLVFHGQGMTLSSQLYGRKGGALAVNGEFDWQQTLSAKLTLKGQDFLLTPEPKIKLSLSPDIEIDYHDQQAAINGQLVVPYGRIEVESLPKGLVHRSDDQIIVDEPVRTVSRSPVDYKMNLRVSVKDDFRVQAMGLDSYIVGQIDLAKQPAKALLASGEMSLREGTYKAFGQDLQIKTGQIGFNGPLDKPYINIRAIRNPLVTADEVIAGVELSGSIAKPDLTIYSQPAMDQAKALAYLLYGQPLGEGEDSDSNVLTQLLLTQSIEQSKGVVSKIGEKLGFSDVSISAKGSGDSTKVEVSGYLSPSFQVSYRVGVFESLSEIAIRYRVFGKLYIEATSGLYDSIDLLYKFDWGD